MIDSTSKKKSKAVNVGAQRVAAIYAKAFLGATEAAQQTEGLVEELQTVADAVEASPRFELVLGSLLVSPDEKRGLLDRVFGPKVSPTVLDFLKVLSNHGRLEIVRAVADEVQKLYDEMRGRVRVELQTATPLADGSANNLLAALRQIVGGEPQVDPSVDPALIGGIVLRVGDTVYDGSVARQLSQVREQMITRSVHEIQSRRDRFRNPG